MVVLFFVVMLRFMISLGQGSLAFERWLEVGFALGVEGKPCEVLNVALQQDQYKAPKGFHPPLT